MAVTARMGAKSRTDKHSNVRARMGYVKALMRIGGELSGDSGELMRLALA